MRAHAQNRGGVAHARYRGECSEARGRCRWWKQGNVFYPLLVVVVVIVCPSLVSLCTLVAYGTVSDISPWSRRGRYAVRVVSSLVAARSLAQSRMTFRAVDQSRGILDHGGIKDYNLSSSSSSAPPTSSSSVSISCFAGEYGTFFCFLFGV